MYSRLTVVTRGILPRHCLALERSKASTSPHATDLSSSVDRELSYERRMGSTHVVNHATDALLDRYWRLVESHHVCSTVAHVGLDLTVGRSSGSMSSQ